MTRERAIKPDSPGPRYQLCSDCDEVVKAHREISEDPDYEGVELESWNPPCAVCVSPGRTPEIQYDNLIPFRIFQLASSQVITVGGGLVPAVPVGLNFLVIESLCRLFKVPQDKILEVIDKVQSLYRYCNDPGVVDKARLREEAIAAGRSSDSLFFGMEV